MQGIASLPYEVDEVLTEVPMVPQEGIGTLNDQTEMLASYGRNGDIYLVHAAKGETVLPMEVLNQNPKLKDMIWQQLRDMDLDPERYVVGNELNSINPYTGQPEFFLGGLFKAIGSVVKAVVSVIKPLLPVIGMVVGGMIPGIGVWLGPALGSFLGSKLAGNSTKSALLGGIMAGFGANMMAGTTAAQAGAGIAGAKAGITTQLISGVKDQGIGSLFSTAAPSASSLIGGSASVGGGAGIASTTPYSGATIGPTAGQMAAGAGATPVQYLPASIGPTAGQIAGGAGSLTSPSAAALTYAGKSAGAVGAVGAGGAAGASASSVAASAGGSGIAGIGKGIWGSMLKHPGKWLMGATLAATAFGNSGSGELPDLKGIGGPTGWDLLQADRANLSASNPNYQGVSSNAVGRVATVQNVMPSINKPIPDFNMGETPDFTVPYTSDFNGIDPLDPNTFYKPIQQPSYAMQELQNYNPNLPPQIIGASVGGEIVGPGTGTSDDIPAMLSDGEFVLTAKAVANIGGGDRKTGANRLYKLMKEFESAA